MVFYPIDFDPLFFNKDHATVNSHLETHMPISGATK